jgi:hypothetical protein
VLAAIALVIFAIWYFFIRTTEAKLTVTAHRWERSVAVEEFRDVQDTAWQNEVPRDARLVTCQRAERSSRQVEDGETCRTERVDKKDGTFEEVEKCRKKYRSEPVYDDRCNFTVQRWNQVDAVRLVGNGIAPAWPSQGLPPQQAMETLGARRRQANREADPRLRQAALRGRRARVAQVHRQHGVRRRGARALRRDRVQVAVTTACGATWSIAPCGGAGASLP